MAASDVSIDPQLHHSLTQKYGQHIEDLRGYVKGVMATAEAADGWTGPAKASFYGSTQDIVQFGTQTLAALDNVQSLLHSGGNQMTQQEQENSHSLTNLGIL
jgi:uncharacterized protein YukE